MNKKRKGSKLFVVSIVILSILLFILLTIFFASIRHKRTPFTNEYSDMIRSFDRGDYADLKMMVIDNAIRGNKPKEDCSELVAFVDYYDAATLYYTYKRLGENDVAAKQEQKMKEAKEKLHGQEFLDAAESYANNLE